jgi:LPS-assembly protein
VVNVAYRFGRNQTAPFDVAIEQVDVSGQWPLFGGWQAVGRYNYSLNENRVIETIAGLEYNSGCWAVRAVMQRYATTASESTSAMFLQLELNDFSRIGSNPLELLKRSIPGYGRVDQPAADPVFGTQQ